VRTSSEGNQQDEIKVTFTDPAAAGNFYGFDVVTLIPDFMDPNGAPTMQSLNPCIQTLDADVETVYGTDPGSIGIGSGGCTQLSYIFLRDDRFNGGSKELRFYVDHGTLGPFTDTSGNDAPVYFQLVHRSEAHLRYLRSREAFYASDGNPFAEPTNVVGNVQGGYGIFVIESINQQEIK
jgi:hypothetical protein